MPDHREHGNFLRLSNLCKEGTFSRLKEF